MVDLGRTLGAGFQLIGRHPRAVAVWALLNILIAVGTQAGMSSTVTAFIPGIAPDLNAIGPTLALVYAGAFVASLVQLLIWAAVYRSVFEPERAAFAYLRVGMDEVRLFVLGVLTTVVVGAPVGILVLVFFLTGVSASFAGGHGGVNPGAILGMIAAGFLGTLAMGILLVFIGVRLALSWPLTFWRKRIILGDAWRLSRNHFWIMFVCALIIIVALYVAQSIVSVLQFVDIAQLRGLGDTTDPAALRAIYAFSPIKVVIGILSGIVQTLAMVTMGGGIAEVALQLAGRPSDRLANIYA